MLWQFRLSLYERHGQRRAVGARVSGALEDKSRILFVVAVHDKSIVVLTGDLFDRRERLRGNLAVKLQSSQNLG